MKSEENIDIDGLDRLLQESERSSRLGNFDFVRLKHVFRKNFLVFIFLFVLSSTLSYLYIRYTKPVYQSQATIKIDLKSDAGVLGIKDYQTPRNKNNSNNLLSEIALIRSNLVLSEVPKKLDLRITYNLYGQILSDEKYLVSPIKLDYPLENNKIIYDRKLDITILSPREYEISIELRDGSITVKKSSFGVPTEFMGFKFILSTNSYFNKKLLGSKFYLVINSDRALQNYLSSKLRVEIAQAEANTINIFFSDFNSTKARDIINAIIEVYRDKTIEKQSKARQQTIEFIDNQLNQISDSLRNIENEIERFVRNSGMADPKPEFARLITKEDKLNEAKYDLKQQDLLLINLKKRIESNQVDTTFMVELSGIQGVGLSKLIDELNEMKREISTKALLEINTLAYQNARVKMRELQKNIRQYITENQLIIRAKIDTLDLKIKEVKDKFNNLPARESEHSRLRRFYNLHENFYILFLTKRVEFSIANAGIVQEFDVLSSPGIATTPIYPVKFTVYTIGIGAWIFFSFGYIVLLYFLQNTIINQEELERNVSVPLLGSVPRYNKEKLTVSALVVNHNPKSAISEALRSIRTNLEFLAPDKPKKIISVTSTISGEGKTFIALNLGGILAMSNQKVILLDLDMRKPKVHLGMDTDNDSGMSSILIGKNKIEECIKHSSIENFDFITAGTTPPNPSELILRKEFDKLIADLHEMYDVVLVDTPPVGLVTDGVIMMQKADIPIYVVRSDFSKKGVEKNINKLVKFNKIKKLTIILNAVSKSNAYNYGYGGYGYGYGYGYYDEDSSRKSWLKKLTFRK